MDRFEPHPYLRNRHVMTLAAVYWPRRFPLLPAPQPRLFEVEPGTRVLGQCHWQKEPGIHGTLVLVHGLEGSGDSNYMRGIAEQAFAAGFNVIRLNQRNCGDTEHLTPTLYNSGLSGDYRAVLAELIGRDGLGKIFFGGYSMGGNLVLKMAAELGAAAPAELRGVCAVCPALDLAACAAALDRPDNFVYQRHFVRRLMRRYRRKAGLFPERYTLDGFGPVRSVRQFDEVITAPHFGFRDAADYYLHASALRIASRVRVPALILAAQDDPFVPFASFRDPAVTGNACIRLESPEHGGHCAFISRASGRYRFWAEARMVDYCISRAASREKR